MEWVLDLESGQKKELIAYEQAVNHVCKSHPFSAICQYDANRFEPDFLVEVMRAHPYVIIDGMITPSPFFEHANPETTG